MSITILQEKLLHLPESCFEELSDFMDFLEFRALQKTGLDRAIAEVERGEYEVFSSFEDFKAAMEHD